MLGQTIKWRLLLSILHLEQSPSIFGIQSVEAKQFQKWAPQEPAFLLFVFWLEGENPAVTCLLVANWYNWTWKSGDDLKINELRNAIPCHGTNPGSFPNMDSNLTVADTDDGKWHKVLTQHSGHCYCLTINSCRFWIKSFASLYLYINSYYYY